MRTRVRARDRYAILGKSRYLSVASITTAQKKNRSAVRHDANDTTARARTNLITI